MIIREKKFLGRKRAKEWAIIRWKFNPVVVGTAADEYGKTSGTNGTEV